jgi:hypothetical protein
MGQAAVDGCLEAGVEGGQQRRACGIESVDVAVVQLVGELVQPGVLERSDQERPELWHARPPSLLLNKPAAVSGG